MPKISRTIEARYSTTLWLPAAPSIADEAAEKAARRLSLRRSRRPLPHAVASPAPAMVPPARATLVDYEGVRDTGSPVSPHVYPCHQNEHRPDPNTPPAQSPRAPPERK